MHIETIQELVKEENIVWSMHFSKRLREREFSEEYVYMVTGYFPNLEKFEADLKTRRVK